MAPQRGSSASDSEDNDADAQGHQDFYIPGVPPSSGPRPSYRKRKTRAELRAVLDRVAQCVIWMAHNGHKVAASTVLLLSCKEFLDLIEEYLVMELFDDHFATHEDYEALPQKPTPLDDCGHDFVVYVMLLSWLASTLRPAWCTLPPGEDAIYVGETDDAARRARQHMNEAQKPVPRFTLYQAAKLALTKGGKYTAFAAFHIPRRDEDAVVKRILKMAPTLASTLKAAGRLTPKDVRKTCVLAVEGLLAAKLRTPRIFARYNVALNRWFGPPTSAVIGVNTTTCLNSGQRLANGKTGKASAYKADNEDGDCAEDIIDTFKTTGAYCKVRLVAEDDDQRYILVLPSEILGTIENTVHLSNVTQRELGLDGNEAYMVLVKLVPRSPPAAPAFMGSFSDALVLALYDVVLELNGRVAMLSWHRGRSITERWSTLLASVREHAGAAPLGVLQRSDLAPIVLKPLPKGWSHNRDSHASSLAMATWRHAGIPPSREKRRGKWTTSVGYTATQRSPLQLPSPPTALLEEAKQQAKLKEAKDQLQSEEGEEQLKLDVVLAFDAQRHRWLYKFKLPTDPTPVAPNSWDGELKGTLPKHVRSASEDVYERLGLQKPAKDFKKIKMKSADDIISLLLDGLYAPAEGGHQLKLFKHKVQVPVPLRPQGDQVRVRIDYHKMKIMWWDAANRTEVEHVNKPGSDLEAKIVGAFVKEVDAKLAKGEKLNLRSSTILLDPEYVAAQQQLAAGDEEQQAEAEGEENQAGAAAEEQVGDEGEEQLGEVREEQLGEEGKKGRKAEGDDDDELELLAWEQYAFGRSNAERMEEEAREADPFDGGAAAGGSGSRPSKKASKRRRVEDEDPDWVEE